MMVSKKSMQQLQARRSFEKKEVEGGEVTYVVVVQVDVTVRNSGGKDTLATMTLMDGDHQSFGEGGNFVREDLRVSPKTRTETLHLTIKFSHIPFYCSATQDTTLLRED